AGPAANNVPFALVGRDVGKFPKIPKRKCGMVPAVKSNGWDRRGLEQGFVNCHVHRRAPRSDVAINVQRSEKARRVLVCGKAGFLSLKKRRIGTGNHFSSAKILSS